VPKSDVGTFLLRILKVSQYAHNYWSRCVIYLVILLKSDCNDNDDESALGLKHLGEELKKK